MRRKNSDDAKKGSPEWMTTYGDMVTLLLCFFVLLFSFSSIDAQKFKAIMNSFRGGTGVLTGGQTLNSDMEYEGKLQGIIESDEEELAIIELQGIATDLTDYLRTNGFEEQVSVEYTDNYVKLNFLDGVLFDPGKATLKEDAIQILDTVGTKLLEYSKNRIKIEGHTDTVPMHSLQFPNNWYLSAARAITVAEYYIDKGIDPKRLSAEGFGEYSPIASNDTPEGRMKNRRIEIKILSSVVKDDDIY